jgi:hypothetical protein
MDRLKKGEVKYVVSEPAVNLSRHRIANRLAA